MFNPVSKAQQRQRNSYRWLQEYWLSPQTAKPLLISTKTVIFIAASSSRWWHQWILCWGWVCITHRAAHYVFPIATGRSSQRFKSRTICSLLVFCQGGIAPVNRGAGSTRFLPRNPRSPAAPASAEHPMQTQNSPFFPQNSSGGRQRQAAGLGNHPANFIRFSSAVDTSLCFLGPWKASTRSPW